LDENLKFMVAMGMPTLAVLIGILVNNSRLSDLRAHIDVRFTLMEKLFEEKLKRVEDVLDARLKHLEEK
jgi:hypothetical protein